jgi:hypothetical protein
MLVWLEVLGQPSVSGQLAQYRRVAALEKQVSFRGEGHSDVRHLTVARKNASQEKRSGVRRFLETASKLEVTVHPGNERVR